ncbi:MAG: NAD(P)-dependent oxidoreductase [Thermodesulfobacteriota bacterium]
MQRPKIGFIGLGNMGGPMARNIVKAGYPLTVFDLKKALVAALVKEGAQAAASAREVGQSSEVILTSLPSPEASEAVWLGKGGVLEGAKPKSIFVELSTVHPDFVKTLYARASGKGIDVVDAGISGGVKGAEDATLTIMVGGKRDIFEKVLPTLQVIGKKIYHVGDIGAGMIVKLVNNAIGHINVVAFIECVSVGLKAGIDIQTLYEVISQGTGSSKQFETRFKDRIMKKNYEAGMKLDLVYKDSKLMEDLASQLGMPAFLAGVAHQVFEMGRSRGMGEKDYAALMELWDEFRGAN